MWDKLFKRELFEGLEFPLRSNSEDRAVLCQVLSRIHKFTHINKVLYAYRLSENSLTRGKMNYGFIQSAIDTENERLSFFKSLRNRELYYKAMIAYEKVMIVTYSRCLLKLKDPVLAEEIFVLFKKYYKTVVNNRDLKLVRKIQFVFFRYFKKIYVYTVFKMYDIKMTR